MGTRISCRTWELALLTMLVSVSTWAGGILAPIRVLAETETSAHAVRTGGMSA